VIKKNKVLHNIYMKKYLEQHANLRFSKKVILSFMLVLLIINCIAQQPKYSTPDLDTNISRLSADSVKLVMFLHLNELRKAKGLKPLKYDARLDAVAQAFVIEKHQTPWDGWEKAHFDRYGNGITHRLSVFGLLPLINTRNHHNYGENIVESPAYCSVYEMMSALADSPEHAKNFWAPNLTSVGFGYFKEAYILIQVFAEFNKNSGLTIMETPDSKLLGKSLWEKACKSNIKEDYDFYLLYFPNGIYSEECKRIIAEMNEI
jgi:hypothetical protein